MQKTAYDYNTAHKDDRLTDLKKKLRSRVHSAEKLLNTMTDEGLLGENVEKAVYIGRILQKLKEEVSLLKRPELLEARHKRVRTILAKAGLDEVANIIGGNIQLVAEFKQQPLIKTAQDFDLKGVLEDIRSELDAFNYGTHLDKFMQIKRRLEGAGYRSEANMVTEIVKKELSNLDGIHKKLVELYTSLSQIPSQGREKPEREMKRERPVEKEIEFPEEARTVPGL